MILRQTQDRVFSHRLAHRAVATLANLNAGTHTRIAQSAADGKNYEKRQSVKSDALTLLTAILCCVNAVAHAEPPLLDKGLKAFGEEDYAKARVLLEAAAAGVPQDGPFLHYYIGESYLQGGQTNTAVACFRRATATPYNRRLALWRLSVIAETVGDEEAKQRYMNELAALRQHLFDAASGAYRPLKDDDGVVRVPIPYPGPVWNAQRYVERGYVEEAVVQLEYWENLSLPVEKQLRTGLEIDVYRSLVQACDKWSEMLAAQQADTTTMAAVRAKARHYHLIATVMAARAAAGKLEKQPPRKIGRM